MAAHPDRAAIRVVARVRPHVPNREAGEGCTLDVSPAQGTLRAPRTPSSVLGCKKKTYFLDAVLSGGSTQAERYACAAEAVVQGVLRGTPGTLFAYSGSGTGKSYSGSGTGKSYSLLGGMGRARGRLAAGGEPADVEGDGGVALRAAAALLAAVRLEGAGRIVTVSVVELYLGRVADLLAADGSGVGGVSVGHGVRRRGLGGSGEPDGGGGRPGGGRRTGPEDLCRGLVDATVVEVSAVSGFQATVGQALERRVTAATDVNRASSRSNLIMTVAVTGPPSAAPPTITKLVVVELAGAECLGKTGNQGERAREGNLNNRSLLALSRGFAALRAGGRVPLRDAPLTKVLGSVLLVGTRIVLLVCLAPVGDGVTLSFLSVAVAARGVPVGRLPSTKATRIPRLLAPPVGGAGGGPLPPRPPSVDAGAVKPSRDFPQPCTRLAECNPREMLKLSRE